MQFREVASGEGFRTAKGNRFIKVSENRLMLAAGQIANPGTDDELTEKYLGSDIDSYLNSGFLSSVFTDSELEMLQEYEVRCAVHTDVTAATSVIAEEERRKCALPSLSDYLQLNHNMIAGEPATASEMDFYNREREANYDVSIMGLTRTPVLEMASEKKYWYINTSSGIMTMRSMNARRPICPVVQIDGSEEVFVEDVDGFPIYRFERSFPEIWHAKRIDWEKLYNM